MRVPWLREQDSNLRLQIMSLIRDLSSIPQYIGRSGGTRTLGILLPKQARYQLRYTPI